MTIAQNVGYVFLQDEQYIYYTESDDDSTIKRVNRSDRKIKTLCTIDNRSVLKMVDEGSRVFVATIDKNDTLGRIFGYDAYGYYVDKSIEGSYYEGPGLYTNTTKYGYGIASSVVDHKLLRDTVSEIDIVAKNGNKVELTTVSGWSGSEIGEFAVHRESTDNGDEILKLGYYSGETGDFQTIAIVNEANVLWTATIGKDGRVYYIDTNPDTNQKELHSVSTSGSGDIKVEKIFGAGEFNVDLDKTGSANMNSTMIFYTYDNDNITVQYRYDIQ